MIDSALKKGDRVVMHTCMESKGENFGKIWTCRTDSFKNDAGIEVVFLDGFSGYFSTKFLQPVSLPESSEGWISVRDRLPTERDGPVEKVYMGTDKNGRDKYRRAVRIIAHFAETDTDVEEVCQTRVFLASGKICKRITHWMPMPKFNGKWM